MTEIDLNDRAQVSRLRVEHIDIRNCADTSRDFTKACLGGLLKRHRFRREGDSINAEVPGEKQGTSGVEIKVR